MKVTAPPEHIAFILHRLTSNGHDAFLVGGCVRDAVMNRPVHDWDLATSATPVDITMLFPKTVLTGERFGTVTVVLPECSVEVTTFRTESERSDGRRPDHVHFVKSIDEDLSRRDFTINAIAESADGEIIDPFGGIKDIANGIIRCVGGPNSRFIEDALRMFRAYRFSAELGFMIESETLKAIHSNAGMAKKISTERIRIELEKTLMSQRPETAGEMIYVGLLEKYIAASGKNTADLDRIAGLPKEPMLRWCVFSAILLKAGHISSAAEFLHDMRLDGKTVKACVKALKIDVFPKDRIGIKQLLSRYGVNSVRCAAAINETINEVISLQSVEDVIASGECFLLGDLAVNGSDLIAMGHPPGQELGETLGKLLVHVIENPGDNVYEKLLELARSCDIP